MRSRLTGTNATFLDQPKYWWFKHWFFMCYMYSCSFHVAPLSQEWPFTEEKLQYRLKTSLKYHCKIYIDFIVQFETFWWVCTIAKPSFLNEQTHKQCEQMARLFSQYLALCSNENLPNGIFCQNSYLY